MLRATLDPGLRVVVTPCDTLAPLARWKHIDVLRVDWQRPATAGSIAPGPTPTDIAMRLTDQHPSTNPPSSRST